MSLIDFKTRTEQRIAKNHKRVSEKIKKFGEEGIRRRKILQDCNLKCRNLDSIISALLKDNLIEVVKEPQAKNGKSTTVYRWRST